MSFIINSISDYSKWNLTTENNHICRPKSLTGIFKHSIWIFKMPYQYTLVTQNISFKHFYSCIRHWCLRNKMVLISHRVLSILPSTRIILTCRITELIIKITIPLIVIGLKNSYFSLIHWPSFNRTVWCWTVQ